jgi:Mn-dependent DtxR family transcriptional regulator
VVNITISKENYLKAIAEAQSEGETVISASLARWLNVSPPAVTAAIKRLKRDELIHVADQGEITLTPQGQAIATVSSIGTTSLSACSPKFSGWSGTKSTMRLSS